MATITVRRPGAPLRQTSGSAAGLRWLRHVSMRSRKTGGVLTIIFGIIVGAVTFAPLGTARAGGPAAGGEIIIIESVTIGSRFLTGACSHNGAALPVTIVATFITPNGSGPVGPYAVGFWNVGYGSYDNHYGTAQGHATTQVFHILLTPDQLLYRGEGTYSASVIVQDVGLAGGYAERDNIPVDIAPAPPYHAPLSIKCPLAFKMKDLTDLANDLEAAYAGYLKSKLCFGICPQIKLIANMIIGYGEILHHELANTAVNDPPDNNYQQVAGPAPPPVLPPPSSISPARKAAIAALETDFANAIGDARAMQAAMDRAWGAGNAGSAYWYRVQMQALAKFAARTSTDLRRLPAAYAALQAVIARAVPRFPVTASDVSNMVSTLLSGLPSDLAKIMTKLGESPADQRQIAQALLGADPSQAITSNAGPTLFAAPQDYAGLASSFNELAAWAAQTINQERPVVTGLSAGSAPVSGGTGLTVYGSNLESVTGISFGPSTPASGLGGNLSCEPTRCDVTVPPGSGTVDLTAAGPGGPSPRTAADRLTYRVPSVPTVTRVFPATGSVSGGTSIAIFGSGLSGGAVHFGPTLAQAWTCSDTLCTATVPPSASADTVDVTVSNSSGSSSRSAPDRFSYQLTPPPSTPPTVTGVSPASGSNIGGDQVTITGSGFTGATTVRFGQYTASSFVVADDSHIMATTPASPAGSVDVTVYNSAGSSAVTSADQFSFDTAGPVVTGISPSKGPTTGGTKVTVTGTNLNDGFVSFGPTGAALGATCTPTECSATTPPAAAAGVVDVQVATGNGQSALVAADKFTYTLAPWPKITAIEPDTGTSAGGTSIAIFGTNLSGATVTVGGQPAVDDSFTGCSLTACSVTTPPGSIGSAPVVVTRADGSSSSPGKFSYVRPGPPSITAVEPNTGLLRNVDQVEVIGQNLTGGTVYFGSAQAYSFRRQGCTQGECGVYVPTGPRPGPVNVSVRTPGGVTAQTRADRYTYQLPAITSVSPSSGWTIGGTRITITGTLLAGGTVRFGNAPAPGFQCTDTTCTGSAPAVSSSGLIDVTVMAGNDPMDASVPVVADHFTYQVLPIPVVTGVSPDSGTDQGGDQVVVTGRYLDGGTVKFGGNGATTESCTGTECTAIAPYSGADGPVDVTVMTSAGTSATSSVDRFSYHPPGVPAVTGVSPSSGTAAGGTPVTVAGSNLTNGVVSFAGHPASGYSCQATSCSAVSPPGAVGTADVQVVNIGGISAISPADHFSYLTPPAPTVKRVSPATGPSSGGTFVTVTGTNLTGGTVRFGTTAATDSACSAATCTANEPAGTAGTVDVTVKTVGGTSATSKADRFVISPISVSQSAIPGLNPGDQAGGGHVYAAPDGTTWFTMPSLSEVGRIAADGTMTVYATPDASARPLGITQAPDGTTWYTESNPNKIVSIAPGGQQTSYQVPGESGDLRDITAGPDGRLWFALGASGSVGAMTIGGRVSLYPVPDVFGFPNDLVPGPDGRVWFTEGFGDAIGAITIGGHVTEHPVPGGGVSPWGIAVGPDGRIWFADRAAHELGAMTSVGVVTRYPLPASDGAPIGITAGPDARLWFTQGGFDQISALDPTTGAATDYPLTNGFTGAAPRYLAMSKDGSLWASETGGNSMIHLTGLTTGIRPTVTFVSPRSGPTTGGTAVTITGANLSGATAVMFGTAKAAAVSVLDAAHVTATAPPGHGQVNITVTTPHGTTAASPAGLFYYGTAPPAPPQVTDVTPAIGLTTGGEQVTIGGANLTGGTVKFGTIAAARATCMATHCTVTTPAAPAGTVDVQVRTARGTSLATAADQFTYQAPSPPRPAVTRISPTTGPAAGGNTITATGTHLAGGIVTLGLNHAVARCSPTSCTVTAPPGGAGTVNLQVTTAGGTSTVTKQDRYTYRPSIPSAPGQPYAVAANAAATVTWTAPPSDGGSPITGYTLIPYRNGTRQTSLTLGTVLTSKVTGLTNGATYTFAVQARNAIGNGPPSLPSAPVVPRSPTSVSTASDSADTGSLPGSGPRSVQSCGNDPYALGVAEERQPVGLATGVTADRQPARSHAESGGVDMSALLCAN